MNMNILDHRLIELNQALVILDETELDIKKARYHSVKSWVDDLPVSNTKRSPKINTILVSEDYVCNNDDYYVGVKSQTPTTVTLPLNPYNGKVIIVKTEMSVPVGGRKVNIITGDNSLIDGDVKSTITTAYGVVRLVYRGGDWHGI